MDNIEILYTTPAHTLEPGDQAIIDGDMVVIRDVDFNRADVDEVFVSFENLSDPTGETGLPLFADDEIEIWSI